MIDRDWLQTRRDAVTASSHAPQMAVGAVATVGETMALLTVPATGRWSQRTGPELGIGGAESNVAIGLARLGVPVTWISRLGDDSLGALVRREIRSEGVALIAAPDPHAPTGLMVKEQHRGDATRVRYYRIGSAASRLAPDDLDVDVIAKADVLHITGITAALGASPLETLHRAVEIASAHRTVVSFDVNYRSSLWSPEQARAVLRPIASCSDLIFAGLDEALLLLGGTASVEATDIDRIADLASAVAELGPSEVVLKLGSGGAFAMSGSDVQLSRSQPVPVIDPVGAGDAFVAGYLSELVAGGALPDCLNMGNRLGAMVCGVPGDWEGLPLRSELVGTSVGRDVER